MSHGQGAAITPVFGSQKAVKWLTILCLAGLSAGVIAGILVARLQPPGSGFAISSADVMVRGWTNAFRALVAPLVMSQLFLAVHGERDSHSSASRFGVAIPVTFALLLSLTALVSLLLTPMFMTVPWFSTIRLAPAAAVDAVAESGSGSAWVDNFIPPNIFAVATTDNILPLMFFAMVFAVAMRRAEPEAGRTVSSLARGIAHACFTIVGWLLTATPLVMLALGFRSAVSSGIAVGEAILGFAAVEVVVVFAVLAMLYLLAVSVGGVSLAAFARSLWPAQLTAIATRSSLATLPAMMSAATTTLRLRPESVATVIPMGGATLKLSRAVSGPVRLLFLAHILGIDITVEKLVVFSATIILLSATTVGVPTVKSGARSLPAYVAAGVPAEYVVLLSVAVSLTDIFLTVLNASGYLTAAAIVDRFGARSAQSPAVTEPGIPVAAAEAAQQPAGVA